MASDIDMDTNPIGITRLVKLYWKHKNIKPNYMIFIQYKPTKTPILI